MHDSTDRLGTYSLYVDYINFMLTFFINIKKIILFNNYFMLLKFYTYIHIIHLFLLFFHNLLLLNCILISAIS